MKSVWLSAPWWETVSPTLKKGTEMVGLVMKSGKMDKTVTVKCRWRVWNRKYGAFYKRTGQYLVHDEENFTRAGDLVVFKSCQKLSNRKSFYVRNIVKQTGRFDYWEELQKEREKEVKDLMEENLSKLKVENKDSIAKSKNNKDRAELIRSLKMKAMGQAFVQMRQAKRKVQQDSGVSSTPRDSEHRPSADTN